MKMEYIFMSRDNNSSSNDFDKSASEVLDELVEMEGRYVFQCGDCQEIFDRVHDWTEHALARHLVSGLWPSVLPVLKQ
jgi:hypothetical protein